jgi:ribosomal protein L11 methyltransferase
MSKTIQITIAVTDEQVREQLIAQFSASGFDAFEEKDFELICFIDEGKYDPSVFEAIVLVYNLKYSETVIEEQNWNALWESNFDPVIVEDFCVIRAHFHPAFSNIEHEIIITPKMSFGTGHHATTYMMIREMSKLDFNNKKVADFGTGTGVLAILAEKLGSYDVWAVDIDDWSIENAWENIEKNSCQNIRIEKADGFRSEEKFDIILANINKNVILSSVGYLSAACSNQGNILLSGLLKEDENEVISAFVGARFEHVSTVERNKWICVLLHRSIN